MSVQDAIGLPCGHAAADVANGHYERTFCPRLLDGGERVGCFTGLCYRDDHLARPDPGIAVAEFRRIVDIHGDAGEMLDKKLSDKTGMQGCAASNNPYAFDERK